MRLVSLLLLLFAANSHLLAEEPQDILLPSSKNPNQEQAVAKSESVLIFPVIEFADLQSSRLHMISDDIKRNLRAYYPHFQATEWPSSNRVASREAERKELETALNDVAAQMRASKLEVAKNKLVYAIERYMPTAVNHDDFTFVLGAREKLVEIYFRLGQNDLAKKQITYILAMDGDFKFNPLYFASVWIDEAEAIRKEMKSKTPARLTFARLLPHSRVVIDGFDMGEAPLEVSSMPFGPHWVRIETPQQLVAHQEVILVEEGSFKNTNPPQLGLEARITKALLDGSWTPSLQEEMTSSGKRLKTTKIVIPLSFEREGESRLDLVVFDVVKGRFGFLGTISSQRGYSESELKQLDKVEWTDQWNAMWITRALAWSGSKNEVKKVRFANRPINENTANSSSQEVVDLNKRKILTIAPRVAQVQPEAPTEVSTSNTNKSIWFWTAIAGGSALALGASVAAIYFLVPTDKDSSTDFDFTVGKR